MKSAQEQTHRKDIGHTSYLSCSKPRQAATLNLPGKFQDKGTNFSLEFSIFSHLSLRLLFSLSIFYEPNFTLVCLRSGH